MSEGAVKKTRQKGLRPDKTKSPGAKLSLEQTSVPFSPHFKRLSLKGGENYLVNKLYLFPPLWRRFKCIFVHVFSCWLRSKHCRNSGRPVTPQNKMNKEFNVTWCLWIINAKVLWNVSGQKVVCLLNSICLVEFARLATLSPMTIQSPGEFSLWSVIKCFQVFCSWNVA